MQKDWLFYIISVLSNLVLIIFVFATLDPAGLDVYFNSDTLYLPSIFKDLFVDKNGICGWHLNPAPNFFPDMFLYFLIRSISGDFIVASFIFSIVQFLGFTCLIYFLNVSVYGKPNLLSLFMVQILINLILLVSIFNNDTPYSAYILLNSYHMGAFLMALWGYIFVFRYVRVPALRYLIWIGIIVFLGVLSDKLFIVLFLLPLLIWTSLLWKSTKKKYIIHLAGVSTAIGVFSLVILKLLLQIFCFRIGTPHRMLDFAYVPEALNIFLKHTYSFITDLNFKTLISFGTILAFIISIVKVLTRVRERNWQIMQALIFEILTLLFIPIVILAPVINGNYTGWDSLRYNIYAYLWGLIALGFFIGNIKCKFIRTIRTVFLYLLICCLILISIRVIKSESYGLQDFFSYYPERVEVIDSISREKDLRYGLANYWDAKLTTMFSRENVKIYAVFDDLTPYFHVANSNWYYGGKGESGNLNFTFIITDRFKGLNQIPDEILQKSEYANIRECDILFIPNIKYRKGSLEPFLVD